MPGEYTYNPVFSRTTVDYIVSGGGRISWELNRHFIDPPPYTFQVQAGHTGSPTANDWLPVGAPVVNTFFTTDINQRLFGKTKDLHYRIQLTTSVATYYSDPQDILGHLSKKDWLIAKEVVRKEALRHKVFTSVNGYLLKAIRYGPRCTECTDPLTEEVSKARCISCYGTGFQNGYFPPLSASYADVGLEQAREHRNPNVGMEKEIAIKARFIGDPQLYSYDVWVNGTTDERYYLHSVTVVAQHRGVALVHECELRPAPMSDIVYSIKVEC